MITNRWRVYINPFDDNGFYTGYQEVTDDVVFDDLGTLSQDLDNADFNIGVYRNNNFNITFRNDDGKYSDIDGSRTIFRYKRGDSLCKITWEMEEDGPYAGFMVAGDSVLSTEQDVFIGLINDDGLTMDLDTQKVSFSVMGRELLLSRATVPFNSLTLPGQSVTVTIASPGVFTTPLAHGLSVGNPIQFSSTGALPGGLSASTAYFIVAVPSSTTFQVSASLNGSPIDTTGTQSGVHSYTNLFGITISAAIYACLNQPIITALLGVSLANVNVGTDAVIDSIVDLRNKTVQQALNDLLLLSNSVLYIDATGSVIVSPRSPSAAVKKNFFGQASTGAENIQNIKQIKNGLSRTFNFLSWSPSGVNVTDGLSVLKYGSKTKSFNQTLFQSQSKQQALLTSILNEFSQPKQEFDLYCAVNFDTIALGQLDRVTVDYPTIYVGSESAIPILGLAVCGVAVLPKALWSFTVSPSDNYKIIGRSIDVKTAIIQLKLRLI